MHIGFIGLDNMGALVARGEAEPIVSMLPEDLDPIGRPALPAALPGFRRQGQRSPGFPAIIHLYNKDNHP
ncbi:hypothetical protein [Azotobacter vinelandii]